MPFRLIVFGVSFRPLSDRSAKGVSSASDWKREIPLHATLLGGVTLVIVPLLALGADQVTKILRVNQAYGVVKGCYC
eukprot:scaffold395390_cov24-Attheya_sp.AAC.1